MIVIFEDVIVNTDNVISIYINKDKLAFDSDNSIITVAGFPDNALQQIAIGFVEGKTYIEMEGTAVSDPALSSSGDTNDATEFSIV